MKTRVTLIILTCFFAFVQPASALSEQQAVRAATSQLAKAKSAGVYPIEITFEKNNKVLKRIIKVNVVGKGTVVKDSIAIDASNFSIEYNKIKQTTFEEYLNLAKVKAWNMKTKEPIAITKIGLPTKITSNQTTYQITFYTSYGISKEVDAKIVYQDKGVDLEPDKLAPIIFNEKKDTRKQSNKDTKEESIFEKNKQLGMFEYEKDAIKNNSKDLMSIFSISLFFILLLLLPLLLVIFQYRKVNKLIKNLISIFFVK